MKKLVVLVMALAFACGLAYAADSDEGRFEPVQTFAEDTGDVVQTAAQGVVDTVNVQKNNPVTTAAKATADVAEGTVKTATFQKIDKK
ncbi:MAG: hypothetical protein PHP46_03690 [Candidatus Omnitrophica bacterium]|nr:hypothetical protein [Candidatus Omnitrophota bacterium]